MSAAEIIFPSLATKPAVHTAAPASTTAAAPANDDFFHGLTEILNPLQHIPIVSTIYESMTGDHMNPVERIAGDTLYGGWLGLASSVANVAFQKITGKDFGDTALAMLHIDLGGNGETALAKNDATPAATTTAASGSRIATAAPTPLMPSNTAKLSTDTALASLYRSGTGLDLDVASNSPLSALPLKAPEKSADGASLVLASLNRDGVGTELAETASPRASLSLVTPKSTTPAADDKNTAALMALLNKDGVDPDLSMRAVYAYKKTMGLPAATPASAATVH